MDNALEANLNDPTYAGANVGHPQFPRLTSDLGHPPQICICPIDSKRLPVALSLRVMP